MRKSVGAALTACALVVGTPIVLATTAADAETPAATEASTPAGQYEAGQYIVVLKDGVAASAVAGHARAHGIAPAYVYRHALRGYSAWLSGSAAARLAADAQVATVERDRPVSVAAQTTPTGIDRVDAELSPTARIDGADVRVDVDVAVLDTGVDLDHPDLNVNTAGAKNCSTGRTADDGNGHGSHVSGTIGALDNSIGVVGVAPGARIWPVRVLNKSGSGTTSTVVCGIDYVTANADKIEVANMSLSGPGSDDGDCGNRNGDVEHQAICAAVAAGVTFAVAAGNLHVDAASRIPAAYDEVITVSALADFDGKPGGGASPTCRSDVDDTFADFSDFGADVDLIAPGVCILSTWKGGSYNTISGTSMATPHVAGGAALYTATHPTASPAEVKSALLAAGTTDWSWPSEDPDGTQEPLLNVAAL
jgi:subtilisin family serine protease